MQKKKYIKTLLIYIITIFIVINVFSTIKSVIEHNSTLKKLNKKMVITNIINDKNKLIFKTSDQNIYNYSNYSFKKINLDELKSINSNTLGFLYIPKTNFSYPIMNTDFYKNHNFYKNRDNYGMPYIYNENKNLSDHNTIVVVNKKMFSGYGGINKVFSKKFLENEKNFVLNLQVNDTLSLWQIVSINKTHKYKFKTSFKGDEFKEYMNNLFFDSKKDFGINLENSEKILTIVFDGREDYVITSKLIKMQRV